MINQMLVRYFFVLLCFCYTSMLNGQNSDSVHMRSLYARGMNLGEAKVDSIRAYAQMLSTAAQKANFKYGQLLSLRLWGYYYETKGQYEKAIDYYFQGLYVSREINNIPLQRSLLTDLAAVYTIDLKQPEKAKSFYLQCVALNKMGATEQTQVDTYINLAAIYNKMGLYDSALYFLNTAYRIGKPLEEKNLADLSSLYNNFGNSYFFKKEYEKALPYFKKNLVAHLTTGNSESIWLDELNLADVYIEESRFDSASKYLRSCLQIADTLNSVSKEADTYSLYAKYYQRRGDYKNAYTNLQHWYSLDTGLVNADTYRAIAELQEKFDVRERENEKLMLQAEVGQQKFHNRIMLIIAVALLLLMTIVAIGFVLKRNTNRKLEAINRQIISQNDKLAELNREKNALIGIVSHDLAAPFTSIGIWSSLLEAGDGQLNAEQKKALSRIQTATRQGEQMIRDILDVERLQYHDQKLKLENICVQDFLEDLVDEYRPLAGKKSVILHAPSNKERIMLLTDKSLLSRICDNLLSNAVKYTPSGKSVWVLVTEDQHAVSIKVKDEGVGIAEEEMPFLFTKYARVTSKPTNGEASTGLGLSIVKRMVEELNGKIWCESREGYGSTFTVQLKK